MLAHPGSPISDNVYYCHRFLQLPRLIWPLDARKILFWDSYCHLSSKDIIFICSYSLALLFPNSKEFNASHTSSLQCLPLLCILLSLLNNNKFASWIRLSCETHWSFGFIKYRSPTCFLSIVEYALYEYIKALTWCDCARVYCHAFLHIQST